MYQVGRLLVCLFAALVVVSSSSLSFYISCSMSCTTRIIHALSHGLEPPPMYNAHPVALRPAPSTHLVPPLPHLVFTPSTLHPHGYPATILVLISSPHYDHSFPSVPPSPLMVVVLIGSWPLPMAISTCPASCAHRDFIPMKLLPHTYICPPRLISGLDQ